MFKRSKTGVLESLLVVVSIAVAVGSVTVVANFLALDRRAALSTLEGFYGRQIVLRPRAEDRDVFYLNNVTTDIKEVGPADQTRPNLELADIAAIKAAAPAVAHAFANERWGFHHQTLEENNSLQVSEITADFQAAADLQVSEGSLLRPTEFEAKERVILLTPRGAKKLRLKAPYVGQRLSFDYHGSYTVAGMLLESDGSLSNNGYEALIPWGSIPSSSVSQIWLMSESLVDLPQAQEQLRSYADATWDGAVVVRANAEYSRNDAQAQRVRTSIAAVFASLGLITATLSIMSLMLSRVLRRQREIGVRRSLGATRTAILKQFLSEAFTLGAVGGLLGVAAGWGISRAYGRYLQAIYSGYDAYLVFSWWSALAALGVALLATLLFGLFPALTAARTSITQALKEA